MQYFESSPSETNDTHPPQPKVVEKKKNEDVKETNLNPTLAFEKFANKVFDSNHVDFSDVGMFSRIRELSSSRSEFISHTNKQRIFESPFERWNRLKDEVANFKKDMEIIVKQEGQSVSPPGGIRDIASAVMNEIDIMDHQLTSVINDKRVQSVLTTPASTISLEAASLVQSERDAINKLVSQLENFSNNKDKKDNKSSTTTTNRDVPTYELYYKPGDKALTDGNLASLDKRIANLEKTIGNNNNDETAPSFPDVQTGLRNISRKLELLDQAKMEMIHRRVKGVMQELADFEGVRAKQGQGSSPHEEKIDQLYVLMTKWDHVSATVPVLVSRLQSLKEIHEDSANAMIRLENVEKQIETSQNTLAEDKATLAKIGQNFASNVKTIQANINTLETRLGSISSKIEQLAKAKSIKL